jgi:hypothetical protein
VDKPLGPFEKLDLEAQLELLYKELQYSRLAERGEPVFWKSGPDRPSKEVERNIMEIEGRLARGY